MISASERVGTRMYQLTKFKKINLENEKFLFKFKNQKIKSQDIIQIIILIILVIILYYVNWVKWTSNDSLTAYRSFISLDEPKFNIINFEDESSRSLRESSQKSSTQSSDQSSNEQESQLLLPDREHLLLDSNHSIQHNLQAVNSSFNFHHSVTSYDESPDYALQSATSQYDDSFDANNELYAIERLSETNVYPLERSIIKATIATSQSSYKTEYDSISLHNDLSPNRQMDQMDSKNFEHIRKDENDSHLQEQKDEFVHSIQVLSSKHKVEVKIDNQTIFQSSNSPANRGLHLIVLNQHNLNLMSHRVFDTYSSSQESNQLKDYIENKVSKNRLLIFAVQDEASYALSNETIELMQAIGCRLCMDLGWRDMYVMLTLNSFDSLIREQLGKNDHAKSWGESTKLDLQLDLNSLQMFTSCRPPYDYLDEPIAARERRETFCSKIEGYADSICNCDHPTQIIFDSIPIPDNTLTNVPIAVIAANRPYYLHSMLNSLLSANGINDRDGINKSMITIYIDGFFKEPYELAKLFGLRIVQHKSVGRANNAKISQHYYSSLSDLFGHYSTSDFAIIFEEDLIVAPDIFHFFSQTKHLLHEDPSIYCISAFNDNSYLHSSSDEKLLYRVETMPGLGWMLTRKLWLSELKSNWPSPKLLFDWDLWMRSSEIRKGRECIIPDVSRTYHLGIKGVNMNRAFHERYFQNRALNQIDFVNLTDVDRLIELSYELHILELIKKGHVINEKLDINEELNNELQNDESINDEYMTADRKTRNVNRNRIENLNKRKKGDLKKERSFCDQLHNYFHQLNSTTHDRRSIDEPVHILYISMKDEQDFDSWLKCASCFQLWDLLGDPRGVHKGMWRFFINDHHVLVIGSPSSPYSVFKRSHVQPILINSSIK